MSFFRLAVIFVFPLLIMGCGGGPPVQQNPGVFVDYLTASILTLDPALATDIHQTKIQAKIHNGLVRFDENLKVVPDLAESFRIEEGGLVYVFNLRKGAKFHSGDEITTEDVAFSFNRVCSPQSPSPRAWVLDKISGYKDFREGVTTSLTGIEILSSHSLKIKLEAPFAPFINLLAMPAAYILSEKKLFLYPGDSKIFNGTGPFFIKKWETDLAIHLEKFKDYFGGAVPLQGAKFRFLSQQGSQESTFLTGGIDLLELTDVNFKRFKSDPKHKDRILTAAGLNVYYIGINCQRPPFTDVRVRQALNYGVDRDLLLKSYKNGQGELAHGSIPPGLGGFDPERKPFPYDIEKAKTLLKEAGVELPLKTEIWMKPAQENIDIVLSIQDQLKKIGVEIEIKKIDWAMLKDAIHRGEPPMYFLAWIADYPDGENFLAPLFHSNNWGNGGNRARFKEEKVDRWIEESQKESDPLKRGELYKNLDAYIYSQSPWIYLWHEAKSVVVAPGVTGFLFTPITQVEKGLTLRKVNSEQK